MSLFRKKRYLSTIQQLEKQIGKELKQMSLDRIVGNMTNGFALGEKGRVEGLNLYDAKLSDISFLADEVFKHVTHLDLSSNQISDVSVLSNLSELIQLDLNSNLISEMPVLSSLSALEDLDLRYNRISQLPIEILQMEMGIEWRWGLKNAIYLKGNPLESPPVEIVRQGTGAVRNYFESIKEKESVRLHETKLLIVGNGEVGKTTLMRKLKDKNFEVEMGKEPTTHGIRIEPWELQCPFPGCGNEKVKIHIWDFGGQAIYHATHQFFLTKRSLYLLVWEARKEEEAQSFYYWFNVIKLLSNESPVIVVMNKSDVLIKHLDEANFKEKFKNIVTFEQVSCLNGDGINKLTDHILATLADMPHLRDILPSVWIQIRDRFEREKRDYISLEEYFQICDEFYLDKQGAMFLSDYLHDIGVILHYHDNVLENIVILNPEWCTEAVYSLIDTREIQVNKGRFELGKLKDYWDCSRFPCSKHYQLIRLMEKFELCFNIAGSETYIIPELLPPKRPDIEENKYIIGDNLKFQYEYDFMPSGIISRFITRVYYLIKDDHFWKNGVELEFEQANAIVKCEPLNRKITVSLSGTGQSELLAIIRNDLEHIHHTMNMDKETHYKEMIPCICSECKGSKNPFYHNYEVLKKFREKRKSYCCLISTEEVSIDSLLRGVEPDKSLVAIDLLQSLLLVGHYLQGISKSIKQLEDSRNDFITAMLSIKGFIVNDQARWGISGSGKSIGHLDFKIQNRETGEESIVEAFNLDTLKKDVIETHLQKLFFYDANGLKRNFILVYCGARNFFSLWNKYKNYVQTIKFKYDLHRFEEEETKYIDIKLARATHLRSGQEIEVFHLFINMRP